MDYSISLRVSVEVVVTIIVVFIETVIVVFIVCDVIVIVVIVVLLQYGYWLIKDEIIHFEKYPYRSSWISRCGSGG